MEEDGGGEEDAGPSDAGADGSAALCPGKCVPEKAAGWDGPMIVWMGAEGQVPAVQIDAVPSWEGWVDVTFAEQPTCPTCTCGVPDGSCAPPTAWSASSTVCQDQSPPTVTSFGAPAGWDGSCTAANSIPAGKLCDGGPCVRSLLVEPPVLTAGACTPQPATLPEGGKLPPPVRTKVLGYWPIMTKECGNDYKGCIPSLPPEYKVCMWAEKEDDACPVNWPDKHLGWEVAEDLRACSACTCGSPEGATCSALVTAYSDGACATPQSSTVVSSSSPAKCLDLDWGTALGSKGAEVLSYQPGACAPSGGQLTGAIATKDPAVLCCLQES
jgi:hypothetical protein